MVWVQIPALPSYKCMFCDQLLNLTGIFVSSVLNESQEFISWALNELICRNYLENGWYGNGEMVPQLRACTTLAEDLCLIPMWGAHNQL